MPEIPDVVAGEPVQSAWGNDLRDRSVQRYDDATDRDTLDPLPDAGAVCWLDDPGALEVYTGTEWLRVLDEAGGYVIGPGLVDLERTSSGFLRATRTGTAPGIVGRVVFQISSGWVVDLSDADNADSYRAVTMNREQAAFMAGAVVVSNAGLVELRKVVPAGEPLLQFQMDGTYPTGRRFQFRRAESFGSLELWAVRSDGSEFRVWTADDQGRFWPDKLQSGGYPQSAGDVTELEARTGESDLYAIIGQLLDRIEALEA